MPKQDFLDDIIQEMESERKQAEHLKLSKIECDVEIEEVLKHEDKVPIPSLPKPGGEHHTPGCLTIAEIKQIGEINKKYFEIAMEERER